MEINKKIVDSSNLKLEISCYVGNDNNVELLLNYIHLFGITKKNYTQINYDELKERFVYFV